MPRKSMRPRPVAGVESPTDVDALLAALEHPHLPEIQRLREIILAAGPQVRESVKWNAPSFAAGEHFATFHLRAKNGVQVVLHLGAKPRRDATVRTGVADPDGLLEWRAADRATVTFKDAADVEARADAFAAIVRQWITFV